MQSFACQARPSRELHPFTAMLFFRFFSYLHINHNGPAKVRFGQVGFAQTRPAKISLAEDSSIKVEIGEINAFEIHPAQVQPAGFSCFAMDAVNIPSGKRYFHLPGGRAITGTPHNHPPFASKSKSKLLLRQLSDGCTSSGRKTKTCFASSKPLLYCRLCQDI